jgi:DNA-entry nuclease
MKKNNKLSLILFITILLITLSLLFTAIFTSTTNTNKQTNNNTNEETTSFLDKLRGDTEDNQEIEENSFSYIANKNTKKFHYSWCYTIDLMNESNKYYYNGTREEMIDKGYKPCLKCNP